MSAVAASIILAAVIGGVIFTLLDSWQRRAATPRPEPIVHRPEPRPRPVAPVDTRRPEGPQDSLWSGWAGRRR